MSSGIIDTAEGIAAKGRCPDNFGTGCRATRPCDEGTRCHAMQEVDGYDAMLHQFPVGVFWRREGANYVWLSPMPDGRVLRVYMNLLDLNEDGEPSRKSWMAMLGTRNRQGTLHYGDARRATSKPGAMYLAFQLWFSSHPTGADLDDFRLHRHTMSDYANARPKPNPLRPGHIERVLDFGEEQ